MKINQSRYFHKEVSGVKYDFRIPPSYKFQYIDKIFTLHKSIGDGIKSLENDSPFKNEMEQFLKSHSDHYHRMLSCIIGMFLHSAGLKSELKESLLNYGDSVFIELEDADWDVQDIFETGILCINKYLEFKGDEPTFSDVEELLSFFVQVPV